VVTAGLTTNWYARPADPGPAVEVSVGDVCLTARDAVLVAALVRALVAMCAADLRAGVPATRASAGLLSAAHWRAAHCGLDGHLIDPRLGVSRPAWQLVDELVAAVSPTLLSHGDVEVVVGELTRLRQVGTGAARQRDIHRRTGDMRAVLTELSEHTIAG
ncbi:MAG TPA: carboxylate--amine ligase, partial [Actinoplanes sp.]